MPEVAVTRFTCPGCKAQIVTRPPLFRISNFPEVSSLTCVHKNPVKCECGALYAPVITGLSKNLELVMRWRKIDFTPPPPRLEPKEETTLKQ